MATRDNRNGAGASGISTYAAAKDRFVSARTVACPECRADIGVGCTSSTGAPAHHRSRRRMAIRLLNEDGITTSRHPVPRAGEIRAARLAAGLTKTELSALVGAAGPQHVGEWEAGACRPTGDAASRLADWFHEVTHTSQWHSSSGFTTPSERAAEPTPEAVALPPVPAAASG